MRYRVLTFAVIAVALAALVYYFAPAKEESKIADKPALAEKPGLIKVESPFPDQKIKSPLVVKGEARGYWFFEASFPIILADWDGRIIAQHYAEAQLDPSDPDSTWMTENYVPFEGALEFESPVFEGADENHFSRRGFLILQKDNPSGLPENDDALEMQVWFE